MDLIGTDSYDSVGVRAVARALLLEEEHAPIDSIPSPAALVNRCVYHLAQAAATVAHIEDHLEFEDLNEPMLDAGVRFTWLASSALTAIARIHPDSCDDCQPHVKNRLLEGLDDDVMDWRDNCDSWDELDPGYWLATVTALFTGSAAGVAELEDCSPVLFGPSEFGGLDRDEIAGEVANALGMVASMATNAAEWFLEACVEEPCE